MKEHRYILNILQYNMRKSDTLMKEFFTTEEVETLDIIICQEPYNRRDTRTTVHPLKAIFHLIYPDYDKPRTCIFVNKRIATNSWSTTITSGDLCSIHIRNQDNNILHVHNVYNPVKGDNLSTLPILREELAKYGNEEQLMLGDFNLHHPSWGGDNAKADPESDELIDIAGQYGMEQMLEERTPTYTENAQTTIDLVYATQGAANSIILVSVDQQYDCHSDHQPIRATLNMTTTPEPRGNAGDVWIRENFANLPARVSTIAQRSNSASEPAPSLPKSKQIRLSGQ